MKYPVRFFFATIFAVGWLVLHNHTAAAVWTAAALIISCFRKDDA